MSGYDTRVVHLPFDERQVDLTTDQRHAYRLGIADADLELSPWNLPGELRGVGRQPITRDGGAGADAQPATLQSDTRPNFFIMWLRVLQMAALAFLFVPINTLAFRDIPPEKTNNASALINLARNFGGSIGISFVSTPLTRREQFHQSRIVEYMQNLNPAYPDYAHRLGSALGSAPDGSTTLADIYQQAVQQATLLSYLEDFKILGVMSLALLPLLLLVKPGKGGGAAVPVH